MWNNNIDDIMLFFLMIHQPLGLWLRFEISSRKLELFKQSSRVSLKLILQDFTDDTSNRFWNYLRAVGHLNKCWPWSVKPYGVHYIDVIMITMASQITSLTVVYSTFYPDADQRKHQSSVSLAFVWGIDRDRWIPRTKGQLRGKCFHLMTSSWLSYKRENNIFWD